MELQVDQEHQVVDIHAVAVEDMGYTLNWVLTIVVQLEAGTEHWWMEALLLEPRFGLDEPQLVD